VLAGAAFLWVPGVGLLVVTGSLASALLGGPRRRRGLLGWLSSLGISKQYILKYAKSVKAGK
jgi:hypothetical protein